MLVRDLAIVYIIFDFTKEKTIDVIAFVQHHHHKILGYFFSLLIFLTTKFPNTS